MDGSLKILLVEDSVSDAVLLQENIHSCGVRNLSIHVTPSLQEAMDCLKNNPIDAILLDLSLPDSSGIETVVQIRNLFPDVPIIVLTGVEDEEIAVKTVRMGVQDYLVKGQADGRLIVRAIRYAIERKRMEDELRRHRDTLELLVQERTKDLSRTVDTLQTEISNRVEAEKRGRVTNKLLELFAKKTSRKEYLDAVVHVIADWSDCESVGIRIADSDGFIPYESCVGLTDEFLNRENKISLQHDTCACVRVITQNPDSQEIAVLTPKGSFRCDNTKEFVEGLSEKDKARYRGQCQRCGFTSVSVVPIRYREMVLGAIHIADKEANKIPPQAVEFLENMAMLIGEALYRFDTEISLRSSQSRLMEAQRIAHLGNWEWDIQKNKLIWSDEVYRIFGTRPYEFQATFEAFLNFVQPQERLLVQQAVTDAIEFRQPYSMDHWITRRDGVERIVHEQAEVVYDEQNKPVRMVGTIQDVTEQELAEQELRQNQEKLRSLATEIILTEERERRTIAAALHDSLGPLLAFSKRELGILRKTAPDGLTESLAYVHEKIKQAVDQTRNLTFDLSPTTLYTLGLEHALEELVEHFAKEGKFNGIYQTGEINQPLTDNVKVLLYRSVRELMINIVKHSGAKNVKVTLAMNENNIQVDVEDDGVGFDVSNMDLKSGKLKGFGLFNIYERLIQAGGQIDFQSPRTGGIKVVLQLPLSEKKE
jgi:PAS domain S-box-containing protein